VSDQAESFESLINGAWDIHVHAAPCVYPRKLDAFKLCQRAQESGMSGLVLKSHHGSTSEVAALISTYLNKIRVYGGVTLNRGVGGLNPAAVEASFKLGGKLVWLPTKDGVGHRKISAQSTDNPITILDEQGQIKETVKQIVCLVQKNDGVLATGHISREEIFALHHFIRSEFYDVKLLINHSLFMTPDLDVADIKQLSDEYTYMECCHLTVSDLFNFRTAQSVAEIINQTPTTNWIVATDSGQPNNLFPVDSLKTFHGQLMAHGVSYERMKHYTDINPGYLLLD
jgi:hypothetical protein